MRLSATSSPHRATLQAAIGDVIEMRKEMAAHKPPRASLMSSCCRAGSSDLEFIVQACATVGKACRAASAIGAGDYGLIDAGHLPQEFADAHALLGQDGPARSTRLQRLRQRRHRRLLSRALAMPIGMPSMQRLGIIAAVMEQWQRLFGPRDF